jgi:hypothetical protein
MTHTRVDCRNSCFFAIHGFLSQVCLLYRYTWGLWECVNTEGLQYQQNSGDERACFQTKEKHRKQLHPILNYLTVHIAPLVTLLALQIPAFACPLSQT